MKVISPSILASDFSQLKSTIEELNSISIKSIHLDIMDGHFVPNLTFGKDIIKVISKIATVPLDAHLMVNNPDFYVEYLQDCKIQNFTFHLEATQDCKTIIKKAKKRFPSTGVAINPSTPVDSIPVDVLKEVNKILIMSVHPGFCGQSYIVDTDHKISTLKSILKSHNHHLEIQVDGGIDFTKSHDLFKKGVTDIVMGSSFFKLSKKLWENNINQIGQL